jgi:hypothetical protein
LRLNFERAPDWQADETGEVCRVADLRLADAWIQTESGSRTDNVELGEQVEFHAVFEARVDVPHPTFGFAIANDENLDIFGFGSSLQAAAGPAPALRAGERAHFSTQIDIRLAPGRYVVKSWVHRNYNYLDVVIEAPHVLDFVVYGTHHTGALVALASASTAVVEERP